jgi:hypothetical protein
MTAAFDDHGTSPARELPPQQSTGALGPLDIPPHEEADLISKITVGQLSGHKDCISKSAVNKKAEEEQRKRQSMMRSTSFRSRQQSSLAPYLTLRRWLSVYPARLCFRRSWHLCCLLQLPCRLMTTMALYQNQGSTATPAQHPIPSIEALP